MDTSAKIRRLKESRIKRMVRLAIHARHGVKVTKGLVDEVLGVDALEGLGLELDPTTKELRISSSPACPPSPVLS